MRPTELTLEQRQIAIAMVDYLREQGYILSPQECKELREYRERDDEWICGIEAAKMLGCSPTQVTRLKNRKAVKYRLEGSKPLYSVKDLNRYIKKRTIEDRRAI